MANDKLDPEGYDKWLKGRDANERCCQFCAEYHAQYTYCVFAKDFNEEESSGYCCPLFTPLNKEGIE